MRYALIPVEHERANRSIGNGRQVFPLAAQVLWMRMHAAFGRESLKFSTLGGMAARFGVAAAGSFSNDSSSSSSGIFCACVWLFALRPSETLGYRSHTLKQRDNNHRLTDWIGSDWRGSRMELNGTEPMLAFGA